MEPKNIHVFLAGSGLIGSALLAKINSQKERLLAEEGIAMHVSGIINTKKMIFQEHLGNISDWKEELDTRGFYMKQPSGRAFRCSPRYGILCSAETA